MKIKIRVSLAVIVLIGCAGCAGTQADRQSALPEVEPIQQMNVPGPIHRQLFLTCL